ncbi:hypothetical protein [Streptomyces sp. NPDC017520]|uniref:hypothetical protein n=1 Tax=Streptomyces sp. NPDC017520 TaxID=3364998 RepID=UPI0037B7E952
MSRRVDPPTAHGHLMKIGIGSDHTGHGSKHRLARLTALGHETAGIGPHAYRPDAGYSPHVVEAAR